MFGTAGIKETIGALPTPADRRLEPLVVSPLGGRFQTATEMVKFTGEDALMKEMIVSNVLSPADHMPDVGDSSPRPNIGPCMDLDETAALPKSTFSVHDGQKEEQNKSALKSHPNNSTTMEILEPCHDLTLTPERRNIPVFSAFSMDGQLDLIAAQPLQVTHHSPIAQPNFDPQFPPLIKGHIKHICEKFEKKGGGTALVRSPELDGDGREVETPPTTHKEGDTSQQPGTNAWNGKNGESNTISKIIQNGNAAVRPGAPVTFDPDKIKKMGIVGDQEGTPSIYISCSDTAFLAEKLGHAVVGKFSHSLPASFQIQKALANIKFIGQFSWKYINAKYLLIQFDRIEDYATMLNGPKGTLVWFIDRHPMRAFKWSLEFNPFFETPIAAVWCNLIGLPIHLFDEAALFAIGNLLGKPIQADHATIAKTRLSFARICVEIDISKPPTEEIIIDILGKETRQKVTWDRIPLYCRDCRHVGHVREHCYAFGKREVPMKRDYNREGARYRSNQSHNTAATDWRHGGKGEKGGTGAGKGKKDTHRDATVPTSNSFQILMHSNEEERERGHTSTSSSGVKQHAAEPKVWRKKGV